MDTIETNVIKQNIPILNTGRKIIKDLYLKTTCDCTTVNDYKKTLLPNEGDTLKIAIDVSKENGYFSKKVILYGTFYPYKRIIEVIGFKK